MSTLYPDYVNWLHALVASSIAVNTNTRVLDRIQVPHIKTTFGPMLSVQAGSGYGSSPKSKTGPYDEVEAMIWACVDGELTEYLKPYDNIDGVLSYVPVELLNRFIYEHGGVDMSWTNAKDTETPFHMKSKHM